MSDLLKRCTRQQGSRPNWDLISCVLDTVEHFQQLTVSPGWLSTQMTATSLVPTLYTSPWRGSILDGCQETHSNRFTFAPFILKPKLVHLIPASLTLLKAAQPVPFLFTHTP